jgi:hypothetical protein
MGDEVHGSEVGYSWHIPTEWRKKMYSPGEWTEDPMRRGTCWDYRPGNFVILDLFPSRGWKAYANNNFIEGNFDTKEEAMAAVIIELRFK